MASSLDRLAALDLSGRLITDDRSCRLDRFEHLTWLDVVGTDVRVAAVDSLLVVPPRCRIKR